jgi:hypothetical protein
VTRVATLAAALACAAAAAPSPAAAVASSAAAPSPAAAAVASSAAAPSRAAAATSAAAARPPAPTGGNPRGAEAAPRARATDPVPTPAAPFVAWIALRDDTLRAAVDLAPALPPDLERQLGNGLTNVLAVHVAVVPARGGTPAAIWGREVQVLYDVWDETYGVVLRDPAAPRGRRLTFQAYPDLRRFLAELTGVELGPAAALGAGTWSLHARLELNPVSKELLERTRELIANPAAGARGGPSRSVLGAMASYLLREPPPGTEVRALRSPPFTAGELEAR